MVRWVLLGLMVLAGPAQAEKVFVAPLTPGAGADAGEVALVDERLLASLRRLKKLEIVGARDVETMLDVEAAKQQAGCSDGVACAAEIAGALDAPTIVTGQLGRVGGTWVLSLSRMDQRSLQVVARVTREVPGTGADALFPELDGQVDELFGRGPDVWAVGGGVALGVGAAGLVTAVACGVGAWWVFDDAERKLRDRSEADPVAFRENAQAVGAGLNGAVVVSGLIGATAVVVGGSMLVVSALGGGE